MSQTLMTARLARRWKAFAATSLSLALAVAASAASAQSPNPPVAGNPVCKTVPKRGTSEKGTIRLTRQALVIQQRIDAAALRRLNAANDWIDQGILPRDLCGGAFGPAAFQSGIPWIGGATHDVSRPEPRPLRVAAPGRKPADFTLDLRQIRINDRISRALLARAQATEKRIKNLTGADMAAGADLRTRTLYPGLQVGGPLPADVGPRKRSSLGDLRPLPPIGASFSVVQLRKTQKRSQRAIVIANRVSDRIASGLTEEQFQPGSIGASKLAGASPPPPPSGGEAPAEASTPPAPPTDGSAPGSPPSSNTSLPTVAGIPAVGRTLIATTGQWTGAPGSFVTRWERSADTTTWSPITGESGTSYTPTLSSALGYVRACVSAEGASTEACSISVGPIVGRPALGVQDDRLPVVPLDGAPERLDAVAATGVSFARVDLFWSDIAPTAPADPEDPDDPGYDWSRADSVLRGFVARGITPLVSFYSTPAWLAGEGPPAGTPVNPAIPDPSAVADFATALVTRYSGRHVPPGATAPLPRLRYLEIWNEPNKVAFLAPKTDGDGNPISLEAYVDMAKAAHAAVKAVDPDVFVLVGALGSGGDARDFLDRIISEDLGADGVSQHLYPAADPLREFAGVIPYPSWQSLPEIVGKLDAWRPGIPLFITEAGYTTAETPFRPPGSSVSEAEQASRLRDIAEVPLVKSGRIGAVVWFNFQDNPGWPAGLLREGDPVSSPSLRKPSYSVFLDLAEIRGAVPPPALGESPPG